MSSVEITGPASFDAGARSPASPAGGVMIVFEPGAAGRAALLHAHSLAADARVPLTVVAIASRERTDVGCGSCRQAAWFRNELACEGATAALREAREEISAFRPAVAVHFLLARGTFPQAIVKAVVDHGAEIVVLSARGGGRLRRRFRRDRIAMLEGRTAASVRLAPAQAG